MNRADYKEREGSSVRIIDTSFFFTIRGLLVRPLYRNRPRVKPVLRLGDGERIKYLIARVLATVSEQNGSYASRFIIFFFTIFINVILVMK